MPGQKDFDVAYQSLLAEADKLIIEHARVSGHVELGHMTEAMAASQVKFSYDRYSSSLLRFTNSVREIAKSDEGFNNVMSTSYPNLRLPEETIYVGSTNNWLSYDGNVAQKTPNKVSEKEKEIQNFASWEVFPNSRETIHKSAFKKF